MPAPGFANAEHEDSSMPKQFESEDEAPAASIITIGCFHQKLDRYYNKRRNDEWNIIMETHIPPAQLQII